LECGNYTSQLGKLKFRNQSDLLFCDPGKDLERALNRDQLMIALASLKMWEKEFGMYHCGPFGAKVGVAFVPRGAGAIQRVAAEIASAWGLDDATGLLVALRGGDRPAVAFAGGLLADPSAFEAAHGDWQAETLRLATARLRAGSPGTAVEVALAGLADAIGGGPGRGMPTGLVGTLAQVEQEMLGTWDTEYQAAELWKSACAEELCLEFFLDDVRQFSDRFERYYHEAMAFPALNILASSGKPPTKVLMLGGGDGGIAKCVLSFSSVERMVLLDIDPMVSELARTYFPDMSRSLSDPRLELSHVDAIAWVNEHSISQTEHFDLVLIDFTDAPLESGWSSDFFNAIKLLMTPTGILVQNIGTMMEKGGLWRLLEKHQQAFHSTYLLTTNIPDYQSDYMLALSSVSDIDPWNIEWAMWEQRNIHTKYYSPDLHYALFAAPVSTLRMVRLPVESEPSLPTSFRDVDWSLGLDDDPTIREKVLGETGGGVNFGFSVVRHERGYCDPLLPRNQCRSIREGKRPILSAFTQHQEEALTIPAMNILGKRARRILVLGGGTGFIASLVVQYPQVEKIMVVDAAGDLLDIIKEFFPTLNNSMHDPRLQFVEAEAYGWLQNRTDEFDLIVVSMVPSPWAPTRPTTRVPMTSRFLATLRRMLAPHGMLAQAAATIQTPKHLARLTALHRAAFSSGSVWPIVHTLDNIVYYGDALDGRFVRPPGFSLLSSPTEFDPNDVDWARWREVNISVFRYSPNWHPALFVLPMEIQRLLRAPPPESGYRAAKAASGAGSASMRLAAAKEDLAPVARVAIVARGCLAERLSTAAETLALLRELANITGIAPAEEVSRELAAGGRWAASVASGSRLEVQMWPSSGSAAIDIVARSIIGSSTVDRLRRVAEDRLGCTGGTSVQRIQSDIGDGDEGDSAAMSASGVCSAA